MAPFAQLERDTMIEGIQSGLAAEAANGRKGGRPRKVDDADAAKARSLRDKGIAANDIGRMLGVCAPPRTATSQGRAAVRVTLDVLGLTTCTRIARLLSAG
jgi:hypothetical protein